MPRSANTLSALNSEPGSFGSEKTIDVLSATPVRQRRRADDQEARDVVVEVLDPRRRATSRPNTSPARAEAIAAGVLQPRVGHHLGAAGGVVGGDDLDAGQRAQEALALRQPLRVRVDAPQAVERGARQRQQMVDHRQLDLADDRQVVLEQQVVVAVDAAADRVLDRQDAVGRGAGLDGVEHLVEAAAGDQPRVGVDPPGRRFTEGAGFALIRDRHRKGRLHTPLDLEVKLIIFTGL